MATPAIALVICTRNRAQQLHACLTTISRLHCCQAWELVIVDNGSSDDTPVIAQAFLCGRNGRYVWEPTPGLGRARNAGLQASEAAIVAFTDDDCYPAADFLIQVCKVFDDPRIGFMGGRILLHDPADYPLTINESLEPLYFSAGSAIPNYGVVQGANMAFRRAALIGVGGFDPMFGAGTQFPVEDWDAFARVGMSGWDGGYFPGPTVSHHHGRTAQDAERLLAIYHYASGAAHAKLAMDPLTRRVYRRYWARRILGDSKQHHRKLVQQFRGAFGYWRAMRERGKL